MFNITNLLINVVITLVALTVHELAHAWVSTRQGDPTPRYEGRLTLNPLAHLDLVGTLLMIFTGFGWAKPVSVNPMYYKDRKKGMALTAAAGPIANFIMAFLAVFVAVILELFGGMSEAVYFIGSVLIVFAYRNLCFMVFNLIPIPPLDGAKVLGMFVPNRTYYKILQYEQYAIILIMLLSVTGVFDTVIGGGVNMFMTFIMNIITGIFSPVLAML